MLGSYAEIECGPHDSIPVRWTLTDADDELINYAGTARLLITQTRIPIYSLFLVCSSITTFISTTHQIIPRAHKTSTYLPFFSDKHTQKKIVNSNREHLVFNF